jgi:hypothetical protein
VPQVHLAVEDAVELAELLQQLYAWPHHPMRHFQTLKENLMHDHPV